MNNDPNFGTLGTYKTNGTAIRANLVDAPGLTTATRKPLSENDFQ